MILTQTYKTGDTFWLLPTSVNPLIVKVTVLEVTAKGYMVDEPVGEVINPNCIFPDKETAIDFLAKMHPIAVKLTHLDTDELPGLRDFLLKGMEKLGMKPPVLREKQRGIDWFNIKDLINQN